ncbi:MAG TPA: PH domain-containing protein [Longimicrobiales bacterium]
MSHENEVAPMPALRLRPLDRRVVRYWRLRLAAGAGPLAAAAGTAAWSWRGAIAAALTALATLAVGAVVVALLPPARYRAWGFAVRDDDLVVRRGALWRTTSVVPHTRIQHVDTRHGPIERRLGLSHVVVHTAGSAGASLRIPGLSLDDAESLRDRLAALSGGDDAV